MKQHIILLKKPLVEKMAKNKNFSNHSFSVLLLVVVLFIPIGCLLYWQFYQISKFIFKFPWALSLLISVPVVYWLTAMRKKQSSATFNFSQAGLLARFNRGILAKLVKLPVALRISGLILIIIALARPQTQAAGSRITVEGIDIVLALDLSRSMMARDLYPYRLEAAKNVIADFITRRKSDKIGLVVFAKDAYTHCPLTLDYSALSSLLAELQIGLIDGNATAIGNALGVSLARLRKSDAKSRVVILLTDGDNNSGNVAPAQAAKYARVMGVKVFTILMGSRNNRSRTNPQLLEEIAKKTGGQAYLATDRQALEKNFENILNELEKSSRKDVGAVFDDTFRIFLYLALGLLLLEQLLRLTRFRSFP